MAAFGIARAPHLAQEVALGQYFAGVRQQLAQQGELDRREVNLGVPAGNTSMGQIHDHIAEVMDGTLVASLRASP